VKPQLAARLPQRLPVALAELTAPCYLHRTPWWMVATLLAPALLVVVAGVAYLGLRLLSGSREPAEIAASVFLLIFLVLLLRPATWRAPIVMAADPRGIYLTGAPGVHIPWRETGPFTVERVRGPSGTVAAVVVTVGREFVARGESVHGTSALRAGGEGPPGFLRLPLCNPGIDPQVTKASLEALRRLSGDERPPDEATPAAGGRRWELVVAGGFFLCLALYFTLAMLTHLITEGADLHPGLLIPLAMVAFSLFVISAGWKRLP
jgi:hypothetical protein